ELFTNLNSKISVLDRKLNSDIDELQKLVDNLDDSNATEQMKLIDPKLEAAQKESDFLDKTRKEVLKMKQGSIALVNQITTVSKIRIYDPKTDNDILSGVKLSNEKLDIIDAEVLKKYTNL
ncbi:MAG: type II toxin-antitoxin system PemK/MazF family toxin, partial [Hungatella sp.]